MTKNNIKAILFASLIVAMVLPFSSMNVADAIADKETNERSKEIVGKLHIRDAQKTNQQLDKTVDELNRLTETLKDKKTTKSEKDELKQQINEISHSSLVVKSMSTEKQKEIRVNIDKLSGFIDRFNKNHNISIVTVGTDFDNNSLRIGIDREGLTDNRIIKIEEKIRKVVGNEIDITIEYSDPIVFLSGCNQSGNCEPIKGGVIITPEGYTACSVGYRATYNGDTGFITAGHCSNGNTGTNVGNPSYSTSNYLGTIVKNTFNSVSTWCDCAFVLAAESVSNEIFSNGPLSGTSFPVEYTFAYYEGWASSGKWAGITDNYTVKVIEGTTVYGLVETNGYAQGGDSGGTVYEPYDDKFMGIITAGPASGGSPSYFTPYYHIQNNFSGISFG